MGKFILISKDAMCKDYLPIYGNTFWNTPNIDALARQGTVFNKYYTAAPSTVMSFYSMMTGKFAHETEYELYERLHDVYEGETMFSKLKKQGYETHIVWGNQWMPLLDYHDYFRGNVIFHVIDNIEQKVGSHYIHDGFLTANADIALKVMNNTIGEIKNILNSSKNIFLWLHLPHVLNGRVSYGSDIDLLDQYIGEIRKLVPDNCIALTSDHGNMNGHKGKVCYGYDVYNSAIQIPLITPRIREMSECNQLTSSVDLYTMLFEKEIKERSFVYSDTAYKAQKHRKIAIMYDKYKYIYNKSTGTEELYDLEFDPDENFSIMEDYIYDIDRKIKTPSREVYFYPEWEKLDEIRKLMRKQKNQIWKNGSFKKVLKSNLKDLLRPCYEKLTRVKTKNE